MSVALIRNAGTNFLLHLDLIIFGLEYANTDWLGSRMFKKRSHVGMSRCQNKVRVACTHRSPGPSRSYPYTQQAAPGNETRLDSPKQIIPIQAKNIIAALVP